MRSKVKGEMLARRASSALLSIFASRSFLTLFDGLMAAFDTIAMSEPMVEINVQNDGPTISKARNFSEKNFL